MAPGILDVVGAGIFWRGRSQKWVGFQKNLEKLTALQKCAPPRGGSLSRLTNHD